MNIAVDLRALTADSISGVTVYLRSVLTELLALDRHNHYFLWWNGRRSSRAPELDSFAKYKNVTLVHTHYSNLLLNFRLQWHELPELDRVILAMTRRANEVIDLFWLPDPRPVRVSRECRLVTSFHDLASTRFPQFFSWRTRIWHRLLDSPDLAARCDAIAAVSRSTADELTTLWGVDPARISVTPLGVSRELSPVRDADKLATLRSRYGLPEHFVLALSTLEPRKNLALLIQAFESLKAESDLPHALVLAGARDRRIFADPQIQSRDWLHELGHIPHSDKAALFCAADAFCFPSIYEGFGLPPLEAMACGTPVLAAAIPALIENLDGAAELVDPVNADAWSIALRRVLTDSALAQQLRQAGLARAKKFDWRKTAELTLKIFEKTRSKKSSVLRGEKLD